jgi:hypothetical protein
MSFRVCKAHSNPLLCGVAAELSNKARADMQVVIWQSGIYSFSCLSDSTALQPFDPTKHHVLTVGILKHS